MASVSDIRRTFLEYFRKNGHEVVRLEPAGAAQRSDADVHQRRHGAVQERLHRAREAALHARRDLAEMRARRRQAQRPRECRLHRPPPHLLRDAGQLLVRRLLQGTRDRARLEPDHQGIRPAQGPAAGHGLPHRRRGGGLLEEDRRACPTSTIIRIPTSDNFWAMGDTGPCGPCSEIFFDHGDGIPGGPPGSPDEDGDRFIEIWNLVFMQFEQVTKEQRVDAAQALDRHRHGAGAHRRRPAGQAQQLRHRPVPRA